MKNQFLDELRIKVQLKYHHHLYTSPSLRQHKHYVVQRSLVDPHRSES